MIVINYIIISLWFYCPLSSCEKQIGPDPWDYEIQYNMPADADAHADIPPDLRKISKKTTLTDNTLGISDIFFKRILALIMKGSQIQKYEDGSVEVMLHMKYGSDRWNTLDKYLKSNTVITESVLRRSMGYIEEAVYKPTIIETVVIAWTEYMQSYFIEYKIYIMWSFGALAAILTINWLHKHISHKQVLIIIFFILYLYEVFISYKEVEQQELERFLSALNKCQWQFWKSSCEVPPPDLIVFMKYMNPLKILVRMFTTIISEPMISLSSTIKTMIDGITDGLWFPFDKIVYCILMLSFNALLIILLVLIVFNYLFNIPFSLGMLGFNIAVKQRKRTLLSENNNRNSSQTDNTDRISGATLNRLLDVFSQAMTTARRPVYNVSESIDAPRQTIRRSASTGRLPSSHSNLLSIQNTHRRKKEFQIPPKDGSGDAR